MSTRLITPTQVLREALRILHNKCIMLASTNKQYSKEFAVSGAKIGSTANVRMPNRYYTSRQVALQTQETQEVTVPVTLTTNYQVGLVFTQQDLTLSLDDFSKRIIAPAMASMSSAIDYDGFGQFVNIYNQVGNPGSTPGRAGGTAGSFTDAAAPQVYLNAGALLNLMACPKDANRWIAYEPMAEAASVAGLAGLLNPSKEISHQFLEAEIQRALGFNFSMGQNVNNLTVGTRTYTNAVVKGANQSGSTLLTTGWTAGDILKKGEVFTIAGVYSVNPENQKSTRQLAMFVATADATASAAGDMTIYISPGLKAIGAQVADGTVTALPANNASITCKSGTASTEYPQNLAYHSDCFTFATADLLMPGGVDFAARENYEGVSMLIVRDYDINNQNFPCRIDVLAGWATLRPELAVRITG